jgi:hypothetical protein
LRTIDRILSVAAIAMGAASILWLRDADKAPIYFLIGYVLWRLR